MIYINFGMTLSIFKSDLNHFQNERKNNLYLDIFGHSIFCIFWDIQAKQIGSVHANLGTPSINILFDALIQHETEARTKWCGLIWTSFELICQPQL